MRKVKILTLILMTAIPFFIAQAAFASTANVWLGPPSFTANTNDSFTTTVYIDSGQSRIGAYNFKLTFNENLIKIDTHKGTDGVEAGPEGFFIYSNPYKYKDTLIVNGFDTTGKGPGSSLNFLIIHWKAFDNAGSDAIGMTVDTLTDELGKTFDSVNTSGAYVTVVSAPLVPGIDIQAKSGGDNTPDADDGTDFGSVLIGRDSKTREFTIPNLGTGDPEFTGKIRVQISGRHADDFSVIQPSPPVSSDEPTTFRIEFTPGAEGLRTALISITSNESNEKLYDFVIQGTGHIEPKPEIDIHGNDIHIADGDNNPDADDGTDFGGVLLGIDSKIREFTIRNSGTANLELTGTPSVQISGTHAEDFSVLLQPSSPVSSDESTTFRIEFTPGGEGVRTASISIASNDSHADPYDFSIQCAGEIPAPEITILGNDISISDGDNTPDAGDGTDFGSVLLGIDSKTREFTIRNSGTADLELTGTPSVQICGTYAEDFSVLLQPSSLVSPYGSTAFRIAFTPGAEGSRTASIRISSNDGNADPYDFSIQGAGEIPAPEITILGNGITIADGDNTPDDTDGTDFGSMDVDVGTKTLTFTIRNLGTSDLELEGMPLVDITGPQADSFSVTAEPSLPVAPDHSTTFDIEFTPGKSGVFTATITIANNDENEDPYNFDIRGTGLKKPERPSLISPEDLKKIKGFEPVLIASGFSDRDQGDSQRASQWQIFLSGHTEKDSPICDLTIGPEQRETDPNTSFTKVQILWGILKPLTSYQWRVRYQDFMGPWWSEWSDLSTFTTADSDPEHQKQQVDPSSGFEDPNMKGAVRGAISCENTKNATVIFACEKERIAVKSINPENLPAKGRPGDFPFGVFSFRIEELSPGESISISFYIPGNYEGGKWWKFDHHSGWHEHKNATFTYIPAIGYTLVEVTVRDGAEGDGDFVSNGVIVDPGGPFPPGH